VCGSKRGPSLPPHLNVNAILKVVEEGLNNPFSCNDNNADGRIKFTDRRGGPEAQARFSDPVAADARVQFDTLFDSPDADTEEAEAVLPRRPNFSIKS
jgi:hypothetical protein